MTILLKVASLAVALLALPVSAQFMAGEYGQGNGSGVLRIAPPRAGGQAFFLNTTGANLHECTLEGVIHGGEARLTPDLEDKQLCIVRFQRTRGGVDVKADDEQACRYYCGARASFGGEFRPVPAACTRAEIAGTRKRFKAVFDSRRYAEARDLLTPLLSHCEGHMTEFEEGWVSNDLALTHHRLGDNVRCRLALGAWLDRAAMPDAKINDDYLPMEASAYLSIVKATRYNAGLCGAPVVIRPGGR